MFSVGRSELKYITSCGLTKFTARYQGCPWIRSSVRLGPQPGGRRGKRRVIVAVATARAVDQVPDAEEVLEAIGRNGVAVPAQRRIDGLVREIEIGGQVPLALVGGVVSESPRRWPTVLMLVARSRCQT